MLTTYGKMNIGMSGVEVGLLFYYLTLLVRGGRGKGVDHTSGWFFLLKSFIANRLSAKKHFGYWMSHPYYIIFECQGIGIDIFT